MPTKQFSNFNQELIFRTPHKRGDKDGASSRWSLPAQRPLYSQKNDDSSECDFIFIGSLACWTSFPVGFCAAVLEISICAPNVSIGAPFNSSRQEWSLERMEHSEPWLAINNVPVPEQKTAAAAKARLEDLI